MQEHSPDSSSSGKPREMNSAVDASSLEQRLRFIEHRGKRILLADVSGCSESQLLECIELVRGFVTRQPEHSVLLLGDLSGTRFTKESIEKLKIAAALDQPHIVKAAWVLSDNMPKVLMESIRSFSAREIPTFATREEALDYLAQ
jgi:hypothetical protein